MHAARCFVEAVGPQLLRNMNNGILVYDDSVGMWRSDETTLKRLAHKHKDRLMFRSDTGRLINYSGDLRNMRRMFKVLPDEVLTAADFWEENIDTSVGKLLFSNGILDMTTMDFTPGFDPAIVFADRIDRPYNRHVDPQLRADIYRMLFEAPFTQAQRAEGLGKYQQIALGRMLFGNRKDCDLRSVAAFVTVGPTATGKSLLAEAVMRSTGTYIDSFSMPSLLRVRQCWMERTMYKRGMMSNDDCSKIDGEMVQRVLGTRWTVWVNSNQVPRITSCAQAGIYGMARYEVQFERPPPGHKDAKEVFMDARAQDAMLDIILEGYQLYLREGHERPECVLQANVGV